MSSGGIPIWEGRRKEKKERKKGGTPFVEGVDSILTKAESTGDVG
jgi:hypothetical protein